MNAPQPPALTIRFLGAFDVQMHDVPVLAFESDKARALLAYLAVESHIPHRRDKLAGLLWPDWPDREARAHLRHCLHNLRMILHDADAAPPFLLADRHAIQFNPTSQTHIDVCALEAAAVLPVGTRQPVESTLRQQLQQAVAWYTGPFLDGFFLEGCPAFEEWLLLTHERLQNALATLLDRLTYIYEEQGALAEALQTAHRRVELDPFVEQSQCQLMRLLALSGQRSTALTQYEALRQLLATELAVEPSPETIRLYQQIQTGQLTAQPLQSRHQVAAPVGGERLAITKANLPAPLTSFVGRDLERPALRTLLMRADVRLVTLLGPAGVGKTRLALAGASDLVGVFAGSIYFVSLAELQESNLVISAIAEQLGIRQRASQTLQASITAALQNQQTLLLLDNFEHLLPAALAVADLLATIPGLKILATSREPLQLYGEHLFEVEPLHLPDAADQQQIGEAAQLFQERAQAVQPKFKLGQTNLHIVAEICKIMDSLPLAIELAAAHIRLLPVEELLGRLTASFTQTLDMLRSGLRNVPDRQRTMRNAIEWSYRLLTPQEQYLFRHVALFVGPFDVSAATAVCGALDTQLVAEQLAALVSKSLLTVSDSVNNRAGFRMLVVLRAFGREQLARHQEIDAAQLAYVHFYLNLLEDPVLLASGEQYLVALAAATAQYVDIRSALLWTVETNHLEPAMRFCAALPRIWSETSRYREADQWLRQVVQAAQTHPPTIAYAATLYTAGFSAMKLGDVAYARDCFERSLAAGIALQNPTRIGKASPLLALTCFKQGDYVASQAHYATCLQVRQQIEDSYTGLVLMNMGYEAACLGNREQSQVLFVEGNALLERTDEAYRRVAGCIFRASVARMQGDMIAVQHYLAQAEAALPQTPARHLRASLQVERAFLEACHDQHELAQRTLQIAVQTFDELGYLTNLIEAADVWSAILALAGKAAAAISVHAAVTASMQVRSLVYAPLEQRWLTELLTPCAATLGADGVAQAQHKGQELGLMRLLEWMFTGGSGNATPGGSPP